MSKNLYQSFYAYPFCWELDAWDTSSLLRSQNANASPMGSANLAQ